MLLLSCVHFLITQSTVRTNRNGERMHPFVTPVLTANLSEQPLFISTEHFELFYRSLIVFTKFGGIPYAAAIFHKFSLCVLSKVF